MHHHDMPHDAYDAAIFDTERLSGLQSVTTATTLAYWFGIYAILIQFQTPSHGATCMRQLRNTCNKGFHHSMSVILYIWKVFLFSLETI